MAVANANDVARQKILQWFYDRNAEATSHRGKKGSAVKISDIKKGLKAEYGLSQSDVNSNLTYLIDKGWINRSEVAKEFSTPGGTRVPATQTWYEISSSGIDKIEGESEFQDTGRFAGINISATGSNIIQLGDGNYVNAKFADVSTKLDSLRELAVSSNLTEKQKLDFAIDIDGIKSQLAKASPDQTVIGHLWDRIVEVATIGGFVSAVEQLQPVIEPLILGVAGN